MAEEDLTGLVGEGERVATASARRRGAAPSHRAVVLVHPPQTGLLEGFSSGLVALANHVSATLPLVHVCLLDLGLASDDEVEKQARTYLADADGQVFVGISTTTASYHAALQVARVFKRLSPTSVIVLGGPHATAQDAVILEYHSEVDCIVRGEGEAALEALLTHYPDTRPVPNLTYREGLTICRNEEGPLLAQAELDAILPTFRGWGLRSAPGKFDHTTYVSARGCPLRCAFCAVSDQPIRAKSVEAVIRDLRILIDEMDYRSIAIEDNFFAHSPERTIAICRAIEKLQRETPFRWDCQTRVESCAREDVLAAMERAGCEAVYIGVEAFEAEQLMYLRKTRSPGNYVGLLRNRVVPWLLRSRIDCYLNLQLGLPGEGQSHRERTQAELRHLGQQAVACGKEIVVFPQLHVVYPGTVHFHEANIEGRFGPDGETVFERFTAWEGRQQPVLRWLGEHFAHGSGGIPEGILLPDRLRRGEFEVDPIAVLEVSNYLDAIEQIPGIRVFKYGAYLAGTDHPKVGRRQAGVER